MDVEEIKNALRLCKNFESYTTKLMDLFDEEQFECFLEELYIRYSWLHDLKSKSDIELLEVAINQIGIDYNNEEELLKFNFDECIKIEEKINGSLQKNKNIAMSVALISKKLLEGFDYNRFKAVSEIRDNFGSIFIIQTVELSKTNLNKDLLENYLDVFLCWYIEESSDYISLKLNTYSFFLIQKKSHNNKISEINFKMSETIKKVFNIEKRFAEILSIFIAVFSIIGINIYSLNNALGIKEILLVNSSLVFVLSILMYMLDIIINEEKFRLLIVVGITAVFLCGVLYLNYFKEDLPNVNEVEQNLTHSIQVQTNLNQTN